MNQSLTKRPSVNEIKLNVPCPNHLAALLGSPCLLGGDCRRRRAGLHGCGDRQLSGIHPRFTVGQVPQMSKLFSAQGHWGLPNCTPFCPSCWSKRYTGHRGSGLPFLTPGHLSALHLPHRMSLKPTRVVTCMKNAGGLSWWPSVYAVLSMQARFHPQSGHSVPTCVTFKRLPAANKDPKAVR